MRKFTQKVKVINESNLLINDITSMCNSYYKKISKVVEQYRPNLLTLVVSILDAYGEYHGDGSAIDIDIRDLSTLFVKEIQVTNITRDSKGIWIVSGEHEYEYGIDTENGSYNITDLDIDSLIGLIEFFIESNVMITPYIEQDLLQNK